MADHVPAQAEGRLDWLDAAHAIEAGHRLPRANLADSFLTRGADTLLTRAAMIDGLGSLVKTATIFPGNQALSLPNVNGTATLFADETGTPQATIDFALLTRWKTAADSLLAALKLARADSRRILIIGAGQVAGSLVPAYRAGFPGAEITLWNRSPERARALAARCGGINVADDLPGAVAEADIIATATLSPIPVLRGDWLRPGQHIDLVGAFRADMREADDTALTRARLFVDSVETTLDHIGEMKCPLEAGVIARRDVLGDFYDIAQGGFARNSEEEITLCKNGGGAHLDLMIADYILRQWRLP